MKYKIAILGVTGLVGQRFVELLSNHPWFDIEAITASEKSVGKKYREACHWLSNSDIPPEIAEMSITETSVKAIEKNHNVDFIFSGLPSDIAFTTELEFASKFPVISKTSAHRLAKDVPLLIPEVNPNHLEIIPYQKEIRQSDGFICTDPNCSTIQLVLTLKPLINYGLTKVIVTTMQAISGAGYPGVSSLNILDNVIPYIDGEEEKIETETLKLLGTLEHNTIIPATLQVSANCTRVNVREGHLEAVTVELLESPGIEEIIKDFKQFKGEPQTLGLPSAPENPLLVKTEQNRPQPLLDKTIAKGMSVIVGRVREDPIFSLKYYCLGHNTIRGAAGAGILSAELLVKKGYI